MMKKLIFATCLLTIALAGYSQDTTTVTQSVAKYNWIMRDTLVNASLHTEYIPGRLNPFSYKIAVQATNISGTTLDTVRVYVRFPDQTGSPTSGKYHLIHTIPVTSSTDTIVEGDFEGAKYLKFVLQSTGTQSTEVYTECMIYRKTN